MGTEQVHSDVCGVPECIIPLLTCANFNTVPQNVARKGWRQMKEKQPEAARARQ